MINFQSSKASSKRTRSIKIHKKFGVLCIRLIDLYVIVIPPQLPKSLVFRASLDVNQIGPMRSLVGRKRKNKIL